VKVGFIGLGSMGLPMAQRILSAGHDLTLYAWRQTSLEPFAGTGVTIAAIPATLGPAIEAVGICVFDAAGVEEVMFGPDGLADTLRPGTVVLVHSTVAPAQVRRIAERATEYGLRVLDAPVSGGGSRALAGELTIMVGGDAEALAAVAELLAAVLGTGSSACVAGGVRLRAGSLTALAGSQVDVTLAKDVELMASVLGDAPGSELVGVARRFVSAMRRGDRA